jgi:peptide/nickel transport system substrate-binding protein
MRRRALLALLLLAGCRDEASHPEPSSEAAPRRGGHAVLGSISDVDSWNEYLSSQSFASNLHRRILLRLAREVGDDRDHPSTYAPQLAESWTAGEDGLSLTFRLRPASWSDGRPVTAEDVRFTWQAQTSAEVGWSNAATKAHVVDVEVVDPRTVTFRFDRAYPFQLADAVEGGILPAHVYGAVPLASWRTHDWSAIRVGSGPFLLEQHRPGDEIVLVRNSRYRGGDDLPRLDRVHVRIVPDAGSLLTQFLAGGLDYVEGFPPREATRVAAGPGVTLLSFDYPLYDYLGWNGRKPPFDDPVVRRALTLAIDREALVDEVLSGYGRVSAGPLLSFWWGADRALEPWPHDPAQARSLLASRGFRPGPDRILARNGAPLAFTVTTNQGNRVREEALVKIQAQLREVGIAATPQTLEMATFRTRNMDGDYDAYLGGWRFSGRLELGSLFGSDAIPPAGNNVVFYRSPEVDRLLRSLDAAPHWRAMKPSLDALQARIRDDQPYTFLYETRRLAAAGPRLHGVAVPLASDPLAGLETWWVSP